MRSARREDRPGVVLPRCNFAEGQASQSFRIYSTTLGRFIGNARSRLLSDSHPSFHRTIPEDAIATAATSNKSMLADDQLGTPTRWILAEWASSRAVGYCLTLLAVSHHRAGHRYSASEGRPSDASSSNGDQAAGALRPHELFCDKWHFFFKFRLAGGRKVGSYASRRCHVTSQVHSKTKFV